MARVRIAHLTPTYFDDSSYIGGGERYVSNLLTALNLYYSEDIDCQIISFTKDKATTFYRDKILIRLLPNLLDSNNLMDATSHLLWEEMSTFDIVHIHQPFSTFGAISIIIARQLGIPIVTTDLGGGDNSVMMNDHGINLADAIICISEYSASLLRPTVNIPIYTVIGPVDTRIFCPSLTSTNRLHQVSCIGRILPHKGIDRVIQAMPNDLPLIVCGRIYDDLYYQRLKDLAKGKNVRFLTNANDDDIIDLYRNSTVNILASTYQDCFGNIYTKPELMGLTVIESMACGTPVLVSCTTSLPELIVPEITGRVFKDDIQLSSFLKDVQNKIWPSSFSVDDCKNHVENKFSMQAVANSLVKIYFDLLNKNS